MLKIKEKIIAKQIKELLHKRGFIVEIRSSKKTKSIYLKLDNGACSEIRISDHKNDKSKAKFNMIKNYIGKRNEYINGQSKKYYNYQMIARLVSDVELERSNRIIKFGYRKYKNIRDKNNYNIYYIYNKNVA